MSKNVLLKNFTRIASLSREAIREKIAQLEAAILAYGELHPEAKTEFPLRHTFVPGVYCREITVPKGMLVVTKLHKTEHVIFMLKGEVSVLSEDGVARLKAPCMIVSPVGAKRVVFTHKETVWTNIHATSETDLGKIEDTIIAKSYSELGLADPSFNSLRG